MLCRKDLKGSPMNLFVRRGTLLATTIASVFLASSICCSAEAGNISAQLMTAASAPAAFAAVTKMQPLMASAMTMDAVSSSDSALPDAPSAAILRAEAPAPNRSAQGGNPAPKYAKYIPSDESAQSITAHDKVIIGLRDLYSPFNFLAMIASAGYEHVTNGAPNYGTDRGAFGARLGAAAIRESTQGFFTDSVFSPMLHMDPRYYVQGPDANFIHRTLYAVTRVLISKTDSGRSTINAPLLLGYAASTALSTTYYPQVNRNFRDSASEYGGSLGGAALGFFVSEFSDQILKAVHMKK
jgi:hypothetical protein